MPTIQLHINSLTHHDIAARREEFLAAAHKAKPKQITAMVNEWVAAKRISEQSCHRDLWLVLHEAGIYTPSESNRNQQVL